MGTGDGWLRAYLPCCGTERNKQSWQRESGAKLVSRIRGIGSTISSFASKASGVPGPAVEA
jgi:hypothetical protein